VRKSGLRSKLHVIYVEIAALCRLQGYRCSQFAHIAATTNNIADLPFRIHVPDVESYFSQQPKPLIGVQIGVIAK
jgi:hypothetical protein